MEFTRNTLNRVKIAVHINEEKCSPQFCYKTKNETLLKLQKKVFILKQKKNQQIKAKVNGTVITALLLSLGTVLIIRN